MYVLQLLAGVVAFFISTASVAQHVTYERPTSGSAMHQILFEDWQRGKLLEAIRDQVFPRFGLERTLSIGLRPCGKSNAFYAPNRREITMCYELMDEIIDSSRSTFRGLPSEQLAPIFVNIFGFIVLHEFGHAAIHLGQIPTFGREEDNADQIAAYMLLSQMLPSQPANVADASVYAIGAWFNNKSSTYISRHQMAGEHSLPQQRAFNFACLALGKDFERYKRAAQSLKLPVERATRCGDEWSKLERAYLKYENPRQSSPQLGDQRWISSKP